MLIVFAIASGFLLVSAIVSLIAAWDVFPSTSQEASPSSSSTSNLCSQLCDDFPLSLSMGTILFCIMAHVQLHPYLWTHDIYEWLVKGFAYWPQLSPDDL